MATSGTYAFAPSMGELALNAFARLQIRPVAITQDHMVNMRMEGNFLQAQWANLGVSLWTVDLQEIDLIEDVGTYDVDPSTVMILDAYIRTGEDGDEDNPPIDRYIAPISRTDYASIASKEQQGFVTSYWFDRLIEPTITLWPRPDGNGPYRLRFYRYRQIQDANYQSGGSVEIPYLFLDAWAAGLAHRLARIYAPSLEGARKMDAKEAWDIAANQNVENTPMYITPGMQGYFRP